MELSLKILTDNNAVPPLTGEWGLSVSLEYRGRRILLDTGASDLFTKNAAALGVDLSAVEYGVLSHAHYDHANGLPAFFAANERANFYLRKGSGEDCYSRHLFYRKYIGILPGTLARFADRIKFVGGAYPLFEGATLLGHTSPGLAAVGKKAGMSRKRGGRYLADDFSHEQSLVLETQKGLVILNSCCHGGADRIIRETAEAFPGKHIYAILGGFHLFLSSKKEVLSFAERVKETGIERVITGHCTGERAYRLLQSCLGDRLEQLQVGYTLEL